MQVTTPHITAPAARERAFSIVEVVIAALVLAIVVAGGTIMFSSSSQSVSMSRVRDKQTAVANEVLAKMQGDASWAITCRNSGNPNNCPLDAWVRTNLNGADIVRDGGAIYRFRISAIAIGQDLAADKVGAADEDGVRPDIYTLRVTIAPDSSLASRFPQLKATTLQQQTNPSNRVNTGRVTINACRVLNQVDERIAAGDCEGSSSATPLVPPSQLDTSSGSSIASTCRGAVANTGSSGRDCVPFKCANPRIASPNPGLNTPCSTQEGWPNSLPGSNWAFPFVTMELAPARGTVTLRSTTTGRRYSQSLDAAGTTRFDGLPKGQYDVSLNVPGYRPWQSKSVPSTRTVTVTPGLNSRAVLMFRPVGTATVRIKVRTVDASGPPWLLRELPGYVKIDKDGNIIQGGTEKIFLVPVPRGRLLQDDKPYTRVPLSTSTSEFVFDNVEPGLYSYQLSDEDYISFKTITNTAGFIYVAPDGRVYYGDAGTPPEYLNGLCAKNVRQSWVAAGTITNPTTGTPWTPEPCDSPSGPSPPVSTGGGGTA